MAIFYPNLSMCIHLTSKQLFIVLIILFSFRPFLNVYLRFAKF